MAREQRSLFDLAAIGFLSFYLGGVLCVTLCAYVHACMHACLGLACLSSSFVNSAGVFRILLVYWQAKSQGLRE